MRTDPAHGLSVAPREKVLRLSVLEERVAAAIDVPPSLGQQGRDPVRLSLVQPPGQADERLALSATANGPDFRPRCRRLGRGRRTLILLLRGLPLLHLLHLRSPRETGC